MCAYCGTPVCGSTSIDGGHGAALDLDVLVTPCQGRASMDAIEVGENSLQRSFMMPVAPSCPGPRPGRSAVLADARDARNRRQVFPLHIGNRAMNRTQPREACRFIGTSIPLE
jgi:hypothetical protein